MKGRRSTFDGKAMEVDVKRNLGFVMSLFIAAPTLQVACGSTTDSSEPTVEPAPTPALPAASTFFSIQSIDVYQATKVSLVADGALVDAPNAPIIAGRPAFVRVALAPASDNLDVAVQAELHVVRPGQDDLVLQATQEKLYATIRDFTLSNTLNFEIPADALVEGAALVVKAGASGVADGTVDFPADGSSLDLAAKTDSQTLHVKLVPISYGADGSDRLPDLSDTSFYRDALYKMYPVADVDISVREPLKWSSVVEPDGDGWGELLSGILQLRRADKVAANVYYVGVFNPQPTIQSFCSKGGCVLGIAPSSDGSEVGLRGALVLGYKNRMAGGTLAQELAHTMGRLHAPCGSPQAIDRKFPYKDGGIGVMGYDVVDKKLIEPGDYSDFMSYCSPVWVSDYTFSGIYQRMSIVSSQVAATAAPSSDTSSNNGGAGSLPMSERLLLQILPDGTVKQAGVIDVIDDGRPEAADAETLDVAFEGGNGNVLSHVRGQVRALSSTKSRFVLVPRPRLGVTRARLLGHAVDVRALATP